MEFGSYAALDGQLRAATNAAEGSGWGVLAVDPSSGGMAVLQVERHQNVVLPGWVPILVIDVREHAYHLKHQNRRAEWVDAVMQHLVNRKDVGRRYSEAVRA